MFSSLDVRCLLVDSLTKWTHTDLGIVRRSELSGLTNNKKKRCPAKLDWKRVKEQPVSKERLKDVQKAHVKIWGVAQDSGTVILQYVKLTQETLYSDELPAGWILSLHMSYPTCYMQLWVETRLHKTLTALLQQSSLHTDSLTHSASSCYTG